MAATDAALGALVAPLLDAGRKGRTLVVLTSDHGESLGEHGEVTHGLFAYEATLRVPLVLYAPRLLSPAVVSEPVRHVDIVPTVLDALLRRACPTTCRAAACSPRPRANGWRPRPATSRPCRPCWAAAGRRSTASYAAATSLIDLPVPEMYDLAEDEGERANLIARTPAPREPTLTAAPARLRRDDAGPVRGEESAETRQQLAALGMPPRRPRRSRRTTPRRTIRSGWWGWTD